MIVKTSYLSANTHFEGDLGRYLWVFGAFLLTNRVMPPKKLAHSRQVIGSKGKCDLGFDSIESSELRFPKTPNRFCPAEYFLNSFSNLEAFPISLMPGRSTIHSRAADLACDMGRDASLSYRLHELFDVVSLVCTQGRSLLQDRPAGHRFGRFTLGGSRGDRGLGIDHQSSSVLHQGMTHIAELALITLGLLVDPAVWIRRRGMGLVGAFLPSEVDIRITATAFRRVIGSILRSEALHRGPGFDQGSVHRKVVVRDQLLPFRQSQNPTKEDPNDFLIEETL